MIKCYLLRYTPLDMRRYISICKTYQPVAHEDKMLSCVAFRAVPIPRPTAIAFGTWATAMTTPSPVAP